MNIISICVLGVFAVISSVALKKYSPEISALLLISCAVMIAVIYLPTAENLLKSIDYLTTKCIIKSEYINILIKSLGICYITQISANVCKENGSLSVAIQIETAGKILLLISAVPVFNDIIETVCNFL